MKVISLYNSPTYILSTVRAGSANFIPDVTSTVILTCSFPCYQICLQLYINTNTISHATNDDELYLSFTGWFDTTYSYLYTCVLLQSALGWSVYINYIRLQAMVMMPFIALLVINIKMHYSYPQLRVVEISAQPPCSPTHLRYSSMGLQDSWDERGGVQHQSIHPGLLASSGNFWMDCTSTEHWSVYYLYTQHKKRRLNDWMTEWIALTAWSPAGGSLWRRQPVVTINGKERIQSINILKQWCRMVCKFNYTSN